MLYAFFAGLIIVATGLCWAIVATLAAGLRRFGRREFGGGAALVGLSALIVSAPFLAWALLDAVWAEEAKTERVPAPLAVASTEYRVEEVWGIGPGGNETGFVLYRLTPASAAWARSAGSGLLNRLGGKPSEWHRTPVVAVPGQHPWHPYDDDGRGLGKPHGTSVAEYLDQYGFSIPIDAAQVREVDRLLNSPGSFYSYGRGGSVTLVDQAGGRVYFFYAG